MSFTAYFEHKTILFLFIVCLVPNQILDYFLYYFAATYLHEIHSHVNYVLSPTLKFKILCYFSSGCGTKAWQKMLEWLIKQRILFLYLLFNNTQNSRYLSRKVCCYRNRFACHQSDPNILKNIINNKNQGYTLAWLVYLNFITFTTQAQANQFFFSTLM